MLKSVEETAEIILGPLKNRTSGGTDAFRHPEFFLQLERIFPAEIAPSIVVTGSKGKGSTSVFLASILEAQGLKVGLFTSPHLVSYLERIRVNGVSIEEEEFLKISNYVIPRAVDFASTLPTGTYLGPIAAGLIIALQYFEKCETDVNVLETGRGALLDEVVMIPHRVGVITPLFNEHPLEMGSTFADIVKHKAGIINELGQKIILAEQDIEAIDIIKRRADIFGASILKEGVSFYGYAERNKGFASVAQIATTSGDYGKIALGLNGSYQAENAAVATAAAEEFLGKRLRGLDVALGRVTWPGRCQVLRKEPLTILDATVSRRSAEDIVAVFKAENISRIVSVVAVPEEKDYKGVVQTLATASAVTVITAVDNPFLRFNLDALKAVADGVAANAVIEPDPVRAIRIADSLVEGGDALCLAGTLSFVGVVLKSLEFSSTKLW